MTIDLEHDKDDEITALRHDLDRKCAAANDLADEIERLRAALKLLYEWAKNWDSPFMEDDEWPEDEAKIKAALDTENAT